MTEQEQGDTEAEAEGAVVDGDASSSDTAAAADDSDDVAGGGSRGNAEAARWRVRLREAEGERDGIAERLAGYQRRDAERLAAGVLSRPSDLWLDGADLAGLLDDDGVVDPARVEVAVASVLAGRPGLEAVAPRVRPRPDATQGQPRPVDKDGWAKLLRGS